MFDKKELTNQLATLRTVHSCYRTFRNVDPSEQEWTSIDDDAIAELESLIEDIEAEICFAKSDEVIADASRFLRASERH